MKAVLLLIGSIFASIHFVEAQQSATIPRIGYLTFARCLRLPLPVMAGMTMADR
jgi:hypothetical protein